MELLYGQDEKIQKLLEVNNNMVEVVSALGAVKGELFENGVLLDLRKIDEDEVEDWLSNQPKDKFIVFECEYGVRSDRAAIFVRNKGYNQAYSL